jgi:glyceraldehyde-3-phosphate dehydrogenase/erythrose-4-phosphate dehydrogenase
VTLCIGINHAAYDPAAHLISNASCHQCPRPLVRALDKLSASVGPDVDVHAYPLAGAGRPGG